MFDYPDGNVAAPLIAIVDQDDENPTDIALGADVYFWQFRAFGAEDDTVVLWRPKSSASDSGALAEGTSYRVALGEGESWESPLFPATQRPAAIRVAADAGSARVEVLRVVRQ